MAATGLHWARLVALALAMGTVAMANAAAPPQVALPAAPADTPAATTDALAPPPPRAVDAADLSAYVDGVIEGYMRRLGIAGVTVAVVDQQGPLLLRGYGMAAQSPHRDVDPARTLFRVGSVSKTFTYLEALKLIDAGKLSLDAPVNDYLPADLRLPDDGYPPVLVRHLLTHSAGYEDTALGHLFASAPETSLSLHDYLLNHRPARVRAPGTHAVYSNYSLALLGAVLARVNDVPFETLAERDLFEPMGMPLTTFREPLGQGDARSADARFQGLWSQGFKREGGGYTSEPFEYIAQIAPAGSVSSNAADMARYLTMLVNRGQLDGRQIIPAAAFARLEGEPLFRNAPDATGFAYGFFRKRYGQVQSLEHGGATLYFHSNLVAVPELGFGVFVSTNTDNGARLAAELPQLLLQRYFPRARDAALPAPPKDFATRGVVYAGKYLGERRPFRGFEKLLLASAATVAVTDDGYLTLTAGGESSRWVEEKPHVFRALQGPGRLAFLVGQDGAVTGFVSPGGHDVYDRAGTLDDSQLLIALIVLAALTALAVITGAWMRRWKRRNGEAMAAMRSAQWLYITAAAWLVLGVLLAVATVGIVQGGDALMFSYPGLPLRLALWWALPVMLLTLVCIVQLWPAWRARTWGFWRKLRHTGAVAIFAFAAVLMWSWNMVGWKL
jgi:CubicO group peptidase (beta-lactamase class C family)